jgi:hypothetical protein
MERFHGPFVFTGALRPPDLGICWYLLIVEFRRTVYNFGYPKKKTMLFKIIKWPFVGTYMVKWQNPLTELEKRDWQPVSVKSRSGGNIQGLFAAART